MRWFAWCGGAECGAGALAGGRVRRVAAQWRAPPGPRAAPAGGVRVAPRRLAPAAGGAGGDGDKNRVGAGGRRGGGAPPGGVDPAPRVLLPPWGMEGSPAPAGGLSGPARRTLRTN